MNLLGAYTHITTKFLVFIGAVLTSARGQSFDLAYSIEEELPVNTVVGNIGKDSRIYDLLSTDDFATLRYRILLYPDTHNNYFAIVNTTGILKTAAIIDREQLCFYETSCKLNLHIAAQTESGQQFYTFKVTVFVQDINDNSPSFSMSTVTVKIDEDAAVSATLPIMSASDRDILNNTLQQYMLITPSDTFGLTVMRNLDDSLTPQLYVKKLLDREKVPHYFLKVMALDGGTPPRTGELSINVTLNDVNDNPPMFTKRVYDESVPEISPVGYRVMTLSATDNDSGNNGRVMYSLGARQSEESFNTFRVVANTGDILLLRDLTSLQGESMRLVVEAVDQGIKPQTAQAVVNIRIEDSVNNAPIIRMTIPPGSPVSRIIENASPGYVVAHFMVEDNDKEDNGMVSCHLQDDTFGLQRIKLNEYKVTVYNNLDRERNPFYDVTITCMDAGSPSLTTNIAFSVILEDANDNPPRFNQSIYTANISENVNTFILRLVAEDIDLGQNGSVSYRLGDVTSLVSSYIYINPTTGEISTKQMLDHEVFKQLDFPVVAVDSGSPSLSSSARVIINVMDQNDNNPRVPSGYYMVVSENKPVGTVIGSIHAIDPDEGAAGQVGYQLREDNDAQRLFNLSKSGEMRTLRVFDREARDVYDIGVLAWDYGVLPLTSELHIRIVIADDNDHAPVLDFPRPGNKTVYTTQGVRFNTTVAAVTATDQDIDENASLTYAIVDGSRGVFDIDPRTGRVFTLRGLQAADKGTYTITLSVRDNGVQTMSTMGSLVVVVSQGNMTSAYTSFANNEHIVIAAILVGITIFIAIVVLLIVIRFLKKEHNERRPKYSAGLPMEVKATIDGHEDGIPIDSGPWRRYDVAKRPNGHLMSGDVAYDTSDDIIMFKLKLADQYKELEPEDKDLASSTISHDDGSSNRTSVMSDLDGAPENSRNRSAVRLATFQGRPPGLHSSGFGCAQEHKVWRTPLKDRMADEITSSSSRETTGADSGRGPSEDGSQSRSSVTDDSGYRTSPNHSQLRGNIAKQKGNYSRPQSGTGYDPPPLLMTFQSNSTDQSTNGGGGGGTFNGMTRKDHSPINPYLNSAPQRTLNGYGRDCTGKPTPEWLHVGEGNITVHKNQVNFSPEMDMKSNTLKKITSPSTFRIGNGTKSVLSKIHDLPNGPMKGDERQGYPRLCSEPPISETPDKVDSPFNKRGIQETGQSPPPTSSAPSNGLNTNTIKPAYTSSVENDKSPGNKKIQMYPPSSRVIQTSPTPNSHKQPEYPQLYKDSSSTTDPHSTSTLPVSKRSGTLKNQDRIHDVPSRSIHDMLKSDPDSRERGDTKSSPVSREDVPREVQQTDIFI